MSVIIIHGERVEPTNNGMRDFDFLAFTDTCEEAFDLMIEAIETVVVIDRSDEYFNYKITIDDDMYNVSFTYEDEHSFLTPPKH